MSEKEEQEHVTRGELQEFAGAITETLREVKEEVARVRSETQKPKEKQLEFYRCSKEGCDFVTDDLGVFTEHAINHALKRLEEEKPKIAHATLEEFLNCPECFPKIEKAFLERGWEKPKSEEELREERRKGLFA